MSVSQRGCEFLQDSYDANNEACIRYGCDASMLRQHDMTHPDFLKGHKVRLFLYLYLLSIPFSRPWHSSRTANKPATPEPKQGKVTSAQLNNNKDLEVDMNKEEPSFFGSFFSSARSQQQKAKTSPQAMEAASIL